MADKKHEIVYSSERYAVMANDVIRGKQGMGLQEAKLLRLLIAQVAKDDKDLKAYTLKISELAEFLNIPKNNLYRDVRGICDTLLQRVVRVGTGDPKKPWKIFQWIQLAEYDGMGKLTLMLSNQIMPFVIELDKYFTQYKLEKILEMNSYYAIRLYELLKSDEYRYPDYYEYSMEFLRQFFDCENKYPRFNNFKERVIDISVREINEKTEFKIRKIEYIKNGRAVVGLRFYVEYLEIK